MNTFHHITNQTELEQLIDRYFDGETRVQEEQLLRKTLANCTWSSETIDETCGIVVKKDDVGGMAEAVSRICENHIITHDSCIAYARKFDRNLCFDSYVSLYRKTGRPQ